MTPLPVPSATQKAVFLVLALQAVACDTAGTEGPGPEPTFSKSFVNAAATARSSDEAILVTLTSLDHRATLATLDIDLGDWSAALTVFDDSGATSTSIQAPQTSLNALSDYLYMKWLSVAPEVAYTGRCYTGGSCLYCDFGNGEAMACCTQSGGEEFCCYDVPGDHWCEDLPGGGY